MKIKNLFFFFLFFSLILNLNVSIKAEDNVNTYPSAYLPVDNYEFDPVVEGAEIDHQFIIQNKGTADLNIEKVKTGWGCTAVSFPRLISPGGEGKINIKVNSNGYGGRKLKKNIVIHTNDEKHPKLNFVIQGKVDKFVTITPNRVNLSGYVGEDIKQSIKIIPEKKYPFKILGVKAQKGKNINYKIEKIITPSKESEYLLTVTNLKNEKSRFFDTIYLETDSKIRPEIKISVYGNIKDRK